MKPPAKSNPLDEIKKIQQKREERRKKMQQDKILKEEKKAYNLASGKNVDIDFEIMIEKSKLKEKLLSPHVSSADIKVPCCIILVGSVRTQAAHLQEIITKWRNRLNFVCQSSDQGPRAKVQSGRHNKVRGKSQLYFRQHIQRVISKKCLTRRELKIFTKAP